jgi:hypothetical protein
MYKAGDVVVNRNHKKVVLNLDECNALFCSYEIKNQPPLKSFIATIELATGKSIFVYPSCSDLSTFDVVGFDDNKEKNNV